MHRLIIICRICRRDQPFVAASIADLSRAIRRAGWVEAIGADADWAARGYCPDCRETESTESEAA